MRHSVFAALLASVAEVAHASRPQVSPSPFNPRLPVPSPPERTKTCYVKAHGNGTDDSSYILSAFHECNNGGHVVFNESATYTIGTAMDWTFLKSIDIGECILVLTTPGVLSTSCASTRTCCCSFKRQPRDRLGFDAVHERGRAAD